MEAVKIVVACVTCPVVRVRSLVRKLTCRAASVAGSVVWVVLELLLSVSKGCADWPWARTVAAENAASAAMVRIDFFIVSSWSCLGCANSAHGHIEHETGHLRRSG